MREPLQYPRLVSPERSKLELRCLVDGVDRAAEISPERALDWIAYLAQWRLNHDAWVAAQPVACPSDSDQPVPVRG
jgi:hypothetical protein